LTSREEKPTTPPNAFSSAIALLLDIAGPHSEHIMMSRGEKKYITISRPITEKDIVEHLHGRKTIGARLTHPDQTTRALCFDADNEIDWTTLQQSANLLIAKGYLPLLEPSPANRGGHLWIIFSFHVDAVAAHTAVCNISPTLKNIVEYWPRPGNQKVRLFAGKYISANLEKWCHLQDAQNTTLAKTGIEAVDILLSYQTPSELIPPGATSAAPIEIPTRSQTIAVEIPKTEKGTDAQWQQKYGHTTLWFAWTPQQLATLYNERNTITEQLDLQKNGMAFSPTVSERTPSTTITPDNAGWIDFSARTIQENGKHDGGDSFELYARRNGDNRKDKSVSMTQFSRELVREAKAALESAARNSEVLPQWIEELLTDAGRKHYQKLRENTGGVVGFIPLPAQPEQEIQIPEPAPPMGLLPLEEMSKTLWSREANREVRESRTYLGTYPPPQRESICCRSNQWVWNGEGYQCGECQPI
jgi:hypothetical protein